MTSQPHCKPQPRQLTPEMRKYLRNKRRLWFSENSGLISMAVFVLVVIAAVFLASGCTPSVEDVGKVICYPTNWNDDGSQADLEFSNTTSETVEVFWEIWDPYFDELSSGSTVVGPPAVGSRESTACLDDYRFDLSDTIGCTVYLPTPSGIETITVDEPRKMRMPRAPSTGRIKLVLVR